MYTVFEYVKGFVLVGIGLFGTFILLAPLDIIGAYRAGLAVIGMVLVKWVYFRYLDAKHQHHARGPARGPYNRSR